jgi:hypothetical protein
MIVVFPVFETAVLAKTAKLESVPRGTDVAA